MTQAELSCEELLERLTPGVVDDALPHMPPDLRVAFELCVLDGMSIRKAARLLSVHYNTVQYRKQQAYGWLLLYLRGEVEGTSPTARRHPAPPLADWETVEAPASTRGRPARIAVDLEERVVALYRSGMTLQEISDLLNKEGIPAIGRRWRPSSFRSLLRRREVMMRPRGPYPKPGAYQPGIVTRSDYEEIRKRDPRN